MSEYRRKNPVQVLVKYTGSNAEDVADALGCMAFTSSTGAVLVARPPGSFPLDANRGAVLLQTGNWYGQNPDWTGENGLDYGGRRYIVVSDDGNGNPAEYDPA